MAFYFALLNVSKKEEKNEKVHHHHHHRHHHRRRHSIASVESPLLDYRLLPRPQLLSDDVVIVNEHTSSGLQESSSSSHFPQETHNPPLSERRSRGSARASKWVHDNHSQAAGRRQDPGGGGNQVQPLCRSKRMAFGAPKKEEIPKKPENLRKSRGRRSEEEKIEKKADQKPAKKEHKTTIHYKRSGGLEGTSTVVPTVIPSVSSSSSTTATGGRKNSTHQKMSQKTEKLPPNYKKKLVATQKLEKPASFVSGSVSEGQNLNLMRFNSNSRQFNSPPPPAAGNSKNGKKNVMQFGRGDHQALFHITGSATDESGRSSSQMSTESRTPRRDDSPASSDNDTDKNRKITPDNQLDVVMKLSEMSMSSRASEPRLKKVTFDNAPYIISNSFLGEGAGKVLVVRRNSGSAVRRVSSDWKSSNSGNVGDGGGGGSEWWNKTGTENQINRDIEKSQTRSILRRGLIRRRSTSDKSRLLAYRNSGFLSNSQERQPECASLSTSRMTVSMDRPKYK